MTSSIEPLKLISFSGESDQRAIRAEICKLGFRIDILRKEEWLGSRGRALTEPTILLLDSDACTDRKLHCMLEALQSCVLGVFPRNVEHWIEEVLCHFDDFLVWPCHRDELAFRVRKVFGNVAEAKRFGAHDRELLEEFVDLNMLGCSPSFVASLKLIKRFARYDAHVLIEGETGTGKDLASRAIHYLSARREDPFIPVNCGAIPDSLIENELFGHERGAFTDARNTQSGLVAEAKGGTLFLDEVDTLSAKGQIVLLRFLEDQQYRPLGASEVKQTDVRIIGATNADLDELCEDNQFRMDLKHRLRILSVTLPPLRQRRGDIELLANYFIRQLNAEYCDAPAKHLSASLLKRMHCHPWEGNVRELENVLRRAFLLSEGPEIGLPTQFIRDEESVEPPADESSFWQKTTFREAKARTVASFERDYLNWLMAETSGNISQAARRSGKQRSALRKLLYKHRIDKNVWLSGETCSRSSTRPGS